MKKYLWFAIIPALAIFVLSGSGTRPKPDPLPKQIADTTTSQNIKQKQNPEDSAVTIASPTGKITGLVVDAKTKEPIPGAVVVLLGTTIGANTDMDGRYTISNVPVGTYTVQARMMGYEPKKIEKVKISAKRTTNLNTKLKISSVEIKKPNIYLYPTRKETLTVQIAPIGKITTSIPEYNTGWNVVVAPGGRINDTYDFLFYEAVVDYNFTFDAGWVFQRSDFDNRMNAILVAIGLNDRERGDFMDYWAKRIDWKKKYCVAYYLKRNEIDKAIPLTVSKNPESLLRVFFKFVLTDTLTTIPEPKIDKFQRVGFSVVEWGGILD